MVTTTSHFSATSFDDAAVSAPAAASSFIGAALESNTTRRYPAFKRFFAIGFPMIPRPIKPVFIAWSPYAFSQPRSTDHSIVIFRSLISLA